MMMSGNKPYQIEYLEIVLKEDLLSLSKEIKQTIKKAIEERLTINPIGFGKPLRYSLKGYRRLRVSNYRIVYKIENNIVVISAIKHRKDSYE